MIEAMMMNGEEATPYMLVGFSDAPSLRLVNLDDDSTVDLPGYSGTAPNAVAISNNGQYAAAGGSVGSGRPGLWLYGMSDFTLITGTPTFPGTVRHIAFSPDSQQLAVAHDGAPYLTIIDLSDNSIISGTPVLASDARCVEYSNDGTKLSVTTDSQNIQMFSTNDWSLIAIPTVNGSSGSDVCKFTLDDRYLITGISFGARWAVIDLSTMTLISGLPTIAGVLNSIAISSYDMTMCFGHATSPHFTFLDGNDFTVKSGYVAPIVNNFSADCAFSRNGKYFGTAANSGVRTHLYRLKERYGFEGDVRKPFSYGTLHSAIAFSV